MLRDGNFEHLKNPELDDQRAAKKFQARRKLIGDNHAADNAIIEEITCINFMCHERLHVELGPLINFVVGLNGSGKSAVLTAITLCLGGKASSTDRGTSLKKLIKNGEESAVLIVKLKNQGNDAYQPDNYGESIIVERHFSRGGSSGYKLKSAVGRTITSKKGDVDDLIEYYQLMVDNPMNVLTQTAAKTFITASTPKMKYQFFREGVQLEALDNDYKVVSDTCDQIEEKLNDSRDDLQALKKRSEDAEAKARLVEEHEGMQQKHRMLKRQLIWSQVTDEEEILSARETAVTTIQRSIEEQESIVEEKDRAFQQVDTLLEQAKEAEIQIREELGPLKAEEEEAKSANDAARKDIEKIRTQINDAKSDLRMGKAKVEAYEKDIAVELQRLEDANGGSQSRKMTEINDAEQKVGDAKEASARNQEQGPQLEANKVSAQADFDRVNALHASKLKEVHAAETRLHDLNQNQDDIWAGYDPKIQQLVRAIRNEQRFREPPVGPIGQHITLLKPFWSNIIESVIGANLNSFVVTSRFDASILHSIMDRFHIKGCNVILGNRNSIDTTGHEPDPHLDTILRVLSFDNDMVRSQLIINNAIDQTILIEKRADASRTMFRGPKPMNVRFCLTPHDSRRAAGHRLAWSGRNQLEETTPLTLQPDRTPRMKSDVQSRISFQREELEHLRGEKSQLETQKAQARSRLQRCEQAITAHKREQGKLRLTFQRAQELVDKLREELENDRVEDGRLDGLKALLEDAKESLVIPGEAYGSYKNELEGLNKVSHEKKQELDSVKERVVDHDSKVRKAQAKVKNTEQARKITLQEKNHAISLVTDLQQTKIEIERKRDKAVEQVAQFTEQAIAACPRVPIDDGETAASVQVKYQSLGKRLDEHRRKQGASDEEIHNAAIEAKDAWDSARVLRKELVELLHVLKGSFFKRIDMFQRFQRYISSRSRINFNYLLSERAFRGKLSLDHEKRLLDVHVEPDETNKSGKGRQTKTLSGGEKSFSSICLLLSLWEAMGAPLRCLDEFDVFMDDVNRDVSTNMIVSIETCWDCTLLTVNRSVLHVARSAANSSLSRLRLSDLARLMPMPQM